MLAVSFKYGTVQHQLRYSEWIFRNGWRLWPARALLRIQFHDIDTDQSSPRRDAPVPSLYYDTVSTGIYE